jgi:imidazolonepropionase-like amidohydrolase
MRSARRGSLLLLGVIVLAGAVHAQDDGGSDAAEPGLPRVTRTYAIRNARIVQAPGRVIEHGTVIVRDGLIAEVGTNLTIPFDAQIVEGDSLTVYAGFIDGLSHAAIPKPKSDEPKPKVLRPGDPPYDRAGIQPERDPMTMLKPDDPSVDSLRMAGFTVTQTVPYGQMLPGESAIIALGGKEPRDMVMRDGSGLFAQFTPADDIYPATTMAIMAKWRGLYREAERRMKVGGMYAESPDGIERPRYDPVIGAFAPVIDGKRPVLFRVESALEVRRALRLQDDLKFPLTIAGLKEGWDIADELKRRNLPLYLSLDFPKSSSPADSARDSARATALDSALGRTSSDTSLATASRKGPFINDERTISFKDVVGERERLQLRQQGIRREYYATAARLHGSGVHFGFSTYGAKLGDLRENIRLAVENGLAENDALAALTTEPARLLGLEKSLGTVDRGKVANLVLSSGNYFDGRSPVRYVFVDGQMYRYDARPAAKGDSTKSDSARGSAAKGGARPAVATADTLLPNPALIARRDAGKRGNLLIRNGTVLTVTRGTLEGTDVLVENGKIAAVGKGLSAPEGYDTIDATGMFVMPGIIDAHSHIAIDDVNEWTNPVTAEVSVGDVLDPYDISIYRALAGGVTVSHAMHGSANVIGGQCQTIKHRYGTIDPEGLVMEGAPRTIKFALGENPTRVHGRGYGVHPSTRMGVEEIVREAFTEARRYMEKKDAYEKERKSNPRAVAPEYDLRMETLAGILRGDILVHCHSYRADEILMLMNVFRDFGIKRIVFQHVNEGFKVAPELAQFGAMASVFADWWAYKFEVYYSTAYNAAILTRNGVTTSINSDSPELDRHLYHEAAKTEKYGGLTADEALALITINPARELGVDDRIGSIEVGKEADLAIFSAHPLSIYAVCRRTIVDGVVRFDRDHDPDDMRLNIDPKRSVETATIWHREGEYDRCMQGTEKLFKLMEGR